MIKRFPNHLILKNDETNEEHVAKIVDVEKKEKKIKLLLLDEHKNIYYRRNREVDVLIPVDKDLYRFNSPILYFDILERIMTIEYPKEINKIHRREHKRIPIKIAMDLVLGDTEVQSFTYDISLGGISFVTLTNRLCQVGDFAEVVFKINRFSANRFWVKIANSREVTINNNVYNLYGASFDKLTQDRLEELTLFLYENDIKMHN